MPKRAQTMHKCIVWALRYVFSLYISIFLWFLTRYLTRSTTPTLDISASKCEPRWCTNILFGLSGIVFLTCYLTRSHHPHSWCPCLSHPTSQCLAGSNDAQTHCLGHWYVNSIIFYIFRAFITWYFSRSSTTPHSWHSCLLPPISQCPNGVQTLCLCCQGIFLL